MSILFSDLNGNLGAESITSTVNCCSLHTSKIVYTHSIEKDKGKKIVLGSCIPLNFRPGVGSSIILLPFARPLFFSCGADVFKTSELEARKNSISLLCAAGLCKPLKLDARRKTERKSSVGILRTERNKKIGDKNDVSREC